MVGNFLLQSLTQRLPDGLIRKLLVFSGRCIQAPLFLVFFLLLAAFEFVRACINYPIKLMRSTVRLAQTILLVALNIPLVLWQFTLGCLIKRCCGKEEPAEIETSERRRSDSQQEVSFAGIYDSPPQQPPFFGHNARSREYSLEDTHDHYYDESDKPKSNPHYFHARRTLGAGTKKRPPEGVHDYDSDNFGSALGYDSD